MHEAPTGMFHDKRAALATMHGKERVIRPLLKRFLGLQVALPGGLDTDRFGTFSREIERVGSQLDAARAKIDAVMELDPDADFGLASEGSFGPHPEIPFLPLGQELVLLRDRRSGLEISGVHRHSARSARYRRIASQAAALAFAEQVGFPKQGLIVMGVYEEEPAPELFLDKSIETMAAYQAAVAEALDRFGAAQVETDLRAHRNPVRMRAIARATVRLVRNCLSRCPECGQPGYQVTATLPGLRCADCGAPTRERKALVWSCSGCGHCVEQLSGKARADPEGCDICNP